MPTGDLKPPPGSVWSDAIGWHVPAASEPPITNRADPEALAEALEAICADNRCSDELVGIRVRRDLPTILAALRHRAPGAGIEREGQESDGRAPDGSGSCRSGEAADASSSLRDGDPSRGTSAIARQITFFGQTGVVICDAHCTKAWGINARPRVQLSGDPDDYAFLADSELGDAPSDPGTYEGGHAKPIRPDQRLNKWCVRECERSAMSSAGAASGTTRARDFSRRRYNMPWLHAAARVSDEQPQAENAERSSPQGASAVGRQSETPENLTPDGGDRG